MKRLILILGLITSFAYGQSKAGFYVVGGQLITVQDTSSRKYLKAVENAGVVPSVLQNMASNFLVTSERAIGSYSLIVAQYPFIGGTAATHKFNLNDPRDLDVAFRLTFNGGYVHSATGVLPNGTDAYARTYFTPSINLSSPSTSMAYCFYSGTNDISGTTQVDIGSANGGDATAVTDIIAKLSNGFAYVESNSDNAIIAVGASVSDSKGFYIGTRNGSVVNLYKNGSLIATQTTASNTVTSVEATLSARNYSLSNRLYYSKREARLVILSSGFTNTQSIQQSKIVTSFNGFLSRQ